MAEIKWIKVTTDIFDDEKIKIIDTMPDRDALIVIWFKLLTLTGKKNNSGLLFMSARMPYTDEMLATIFNRPLNTVRMALKLFEDFEMIEIADNKVISVINWEKHQNIDGMDKIRENSKISSAKYREKQKTLMLQNDKSDITVTSRDHTEKIRIEEDKNINIEFSLFWELYNFKTGKALAEKKWDKLKDLEREEIMKTLPIYVSDTLGKGEKSDEFKPMRKNATTYLNQEGWKDFEGVKESDIKKGYDEFNDKVNGWV